jgi:hypothetical protein
MEVGVTVGAPAVVPASDAGLDIRLARAWLLRELGGCIRAVTQARDRFFRTECLGNIPRHSKQC